MGLNLIGKIELDGAGFERGLHKATDRVTEFAKAAVVTAFGFYGVEEAIRKTVETASELVNESKRLSLTVEQLQILRQAAKDAGTEMNTISTALEKINVARAKAMGGDKASMAAFAKLGVSPAQLANQSAADIFTGSIANTVKNGSVQSLTPALKEILGRAFGEVIPVLKTNFDELGETLKKFGLDMDAETAVKLKHMGDEFDLIAKVITTLLGPSLVRFAQWLLESIPKSKTVESVDFLAKRSQELAKLPDFTNSKGETWTAAQRAATASGFIDTIQLAMKQGMSFDQFKKTNPYSFQGAFEDFKGDSLKDFNSYLVGITNPVNAATQKAGQESGNDVKGFQKLVDDFIKSMDDEAKRLEHPEKPVDAGPPKTPASKTPHTQTDALVKVGNFLGSNGNTISRVDQRKINLMEQHLTELKGIKQAIHTSGGTFATGIPHVT